LKPDKIISLFCVIHLLMLVASLFFFFFKILPFISANQNTNSQIENVYLALSYMMQQLSSVPIFDAPIHGDKLTAWQCLYLYLSFCFRTIGLSLGCVYIIAFRRKIGWFILLTVSIFTLIHGLIWQMVLLENIIIINTFMFDGTYAFFIYFLFQKKTKHHFETILS